MYNSPPFTVGEISEVRWLDRTNSNQGYNMLVSIKVGFTILIFLDYIKSIKVYQQYGFQFTDTIYWQCCYNKDTLTDKETPSVL